MDTAAGSRGLLVRFITSLSSGVFFLDFVYPEDDPTSVLCEVRRHKFPVCLCDGEAVYNLPVIL